MPCDVSVIGLGRVGLPLALCFADAGLSVLGVDKDAERLEAVRAGGCRSRSPAPTSCSRACSSSCRARAADAARADAIVLTLGTPSFSHIEIDMGDIRAVLDDLLPHLREGHLLVLRSTVAPGTTDFVAGYLEKHRGFKVGEDVFVAHVPERIAADRFLEEIGTLPCIVGGVGEALRRARRAAVRGARGADRADDAGAGRAGEDLDQHPALRDVRAAQPADDGLRAVRRERVRGDRPDQPRLSARRHGEPGPHRRHVPAQGLRVLGGEVERPRHAARRLARARERAAVPRRRHQAPARRRCASARSRCSGSRSSATPTTSATRCRTSSIRLLERELADVAVHDPVVATPTSSFEDAVAAADAVVVATNHSAFSTADALQAIVERAGADCLVVDPWNALGAAQVFAYTNEIAALRT